MNPLFTKAIPVLEKIENAGFEAYFVGGAVRDHLLNREIADVDIASSATPEEIKGIFLNTVDVGIEHGTVLVLDNGSGYEITTFRNESEYKDFRRPDEVVFIRSLEEDLKRRDFTMNAMAMDKNGVIIDPFCGQQAIRLKRIETVGKAEERFSEDALRMMRAIRFVSQLSFSLDNTCFQALGKMTSLLNHIAVERKTAEFEKLLLGKDRITAIDLLCKANIDQYLPKLSGVPTRITAITQFQCTDLNLVEMWTLLLYALKIKSDDVEVFLRSWKLPIKRIRQIALILHWVQVRFKQTWSRSTMYEAGEETMVHTERVYNVIQKQDISHLINQWIEQFGDLSIKSRSEVMVTGKDLMEMLDQPAGPWIKNCLEMIEKAILEEGLENDRENIRKWVLTCNLK